jgi:ketosteroid isomerase-like protein
MSHFTAEPAGTAEVQMTRYDQRIGPREVLERLREATIDQSIEEMRRLYAVDAVHEFPFTRPGLPSRLEGREEIMDWITEVWSAYPLRFDSYRTLAVHATTDSETIVVEQEARGRSGAAGEVTLPNIMVLTARNGQVTHLRDYVNIMAAEAATGERA